MNSWRKIIVVAVLMLIGGALRLPIEQSLSRHLQVQGLLEDELEIGTRERIGQTSSAIALGGMRTLVATFLHLRAFNFFGEGRWDDLRTTYELIVDLAPHTSYYWESGAWHLAYNAGAYYQRASDLPILRRRELWRHFVGAGRNFLERGIRNNPTEWRLYRDLGMLLSDPRKVPAFDDPISSYRAAAAAYHAGSELPHALPVLKRQELYALARVPDQRAEALRLAQQLYAASPRNHTPTLLCVLFVLEQGTQPAKQAAERAIEIFGSAEQAHDLLAVYWQRPHTALPVTGVTAALSELEAELKIPPKDSVLRQASNRPDEFAPDFEP